MPLPAILSSCVDAISNRLEELVCHCKQLHTLNQSLEMENASLRLKLGSIGERREVSNCVSTPEVEAAEQAQNLPRVKDVFLEPERPDEVMLPGRLPLPPPARHPWMPDPEGSPADSELRLLGVPSRVATTELEEEAEESDVEYLDAKSMHFDTLVSHRLQLITDTRLADDTTFNRAEWEQTWNLMKLESDEYTGAKVFQSFVNTLFFKTVSMLAIMANAVYIGLRTDQQIKNSFSRVQGQTPADMENLLEWVFLVWFSVEILLNLIAFRTNFFIGKNWHWNIFDLFLVGNAAVEVMVPSLFANMSFLRICRVFRLIRVVRLVRTVKWLRSLRTMLFAIIKSISCLLWAFVMIILVMFVFSIIFGNAAASYFETLDLNDPTEVENALRVHLLFGSMYESCVSLFCAIFGGNDWMFYGDMLRILGSGDLYFVFFLFYIGFCLVGLLNVVTGIFVDSAVCTRTEDEVVDSYREDLQRTSDEVKRIFNAADTHSSGMLTLEAFSQCLNQNAWVAAYFAGLDIGADDAGTIFTLMDTNNSGDITVDEFVQGTMKLKGHAKSIDIFAIMFDITRLGLQVQKLCSSMEDQFRDIKRILEPGRALPKKRLFKPVKQLMQELDQPDSDDPTRSTRLRLLKRLSQARVA
ncbi:unnamed protein product [Effrenium voratum]|nr:unnamed protein product [Effrenium voratum]